MRPTPTEQAQRLREMAAIIRATAPAGRYRQTTLVPATYMEWAADTIEELLGARSRLLDVISGEARPSDAQRATLALLQDVSSATASWGLPDWERTRELLQRVGDHLLSLLEVITDRCPTCQTPTCASCFVACAVCGREFCGACLDRVCPEHEVSAEEGAALVREGFEDIGVDFVEDIYWCPTCNTDTIHDVVESGHERDMSGDSRSCKTCQTRWSGLTGKHSRRVRDFSRGAHPARYKWELIP